MRILVTGGAGFLGSHLCKALLERDDEVFCLDNFYTGKVKNIENLLDKSNFNLIEHDVTDPYKIKVDQIYNLACPASPRHYQANPVQTTKTNFLGALNMLELARSNGARILQASTSEIYGDPEVHPQKEEYWGKVNPIGIRSCYDEGKRVAETLFFDYWRQYGLDIKIIRIFNTYGPNMHPDDGRVVSNFINQALTNRPITIYGNGNQTRSFCYVDDLVTGMIAFMNSNEEHIGPVNLGNPQELTILGLAQTILKLTDSKSSLIFKNLPEDDPAQRKPDINLAKLLVNWSPKVDIIEGLLKTIDYFSTLDNS